MSQAFQPPASPKIAVIGLGYVGLPLAVALAGRYDTLGYDINPARVEALRQGIDHTREVSAATLQATSINFSDNAESLADRNVCIVTVPTPVDDAKRPDFAPLISASQAVGEHLKSGDVVIFESTVYPGATEEICVPVLEAASGLRYNQDFFCGYSPERINPGDQQRGIADIIKITAGSTPEVAAFVDQLYASIIHAGTHPVSSIAVAEAAKVIENTQRDLNIGLVNELAVLFSHMGIDSGEVLDAASTKWNFLPFRPGLAGGHCISVDPYYLIHKAEQLGFHTSVIQAARRINDAMGEHIAERVIKMMAKRRLMAPDAPVLVMGLSFKENCPDIRNTRVADVVSTLRDYGLQVDIHDPWVDPTQAMEELGLELTETPTQNHYHAIILAVAHREFREMGPEKIRQLGTEQAVLFDVKHVFKRGEADGRL